MGTLVAMTLAGAVIVAMVAAVIVGVIVAVVGAVIVGVIVAVVGAVIMLLVVHWLPQVRPTRMARAEFPLG